MRGLLVAQFDRNTFHGLPGEKQFLSGTKPLFIQPFFGVLSKGALKIPLELPQGNITNLCESPRVVMRLPG